jgi:hypothetical protein
MIGVLAHSDDRKIVEEFFQLFKTSWEFYDPSRRYDVLLITEGEIPECESHLVLIYGTKTYQDDLYITNGKQFADIDPCICVDNVSVPIYHGMISFLNVDSPLAVPINSNDVVAYETYKGTQRIIRVGYDLFREIGFLLMEGQPARNAMLPSLELHITMLRNWIIGSGLALSEIPPVPAGYRFIACLSHDVDFIGIRRHFMDHSMGGFLYRATLGSVLDFIRGRAGLSRVAENFKAVISLPFVFLDICCDPWDQFDKYIEVEKGTRSTYFFIPFKNNPGVGFSEGRNKYRAAKYDVDDVNDTIKKLLSHGCEAGVHGIDAWRDVELGRNELKRVRDITGLNVIGIRTHWLCHNKASFRTLDQAGYDYDSSFGYNENVGFRAGTAQVYRPIGANHLLELPMHIQDTALFGSGRMRLSDGDAEKLCDQIIEGVDGYKGVLTILWHQRSLGPERLWGHFYQMLLKKLKEWNAWFATAGDVVAWFRMRRAARFLPTGEIDAPSYPFEGNANLPYLVLKKYSSNSILRSDEAVEFTEETIQPWPA